MYNGPDPPSETASPVVIAAGATTPPGCTDSVVSTGTHDPSAAGTWNGTSDSSSSNPPPGRANVCE